MAVQQNDDALRNFRDQVIKGSGLFEKDRVGIKRAVRLTNKTSDLIEWARFLPSDTPQAKAYVDALTAKQKLELLFDVIGADSKRAWRMFWKPVLGALREVASQRRVTLSPGRGVDLCRITPSLSHTLITFVCST